MINISIVIPVFEAENIIEDLTVRIEDSINNDKLIYEIILVDDGSEDNSWDLIQSLAKDNLKVKGIKLSRNFGQHYAILAGLTKSSGENVVVMDCDLQENPIYINDLIKKRMEGYEIVYSMRNNRNFGLIKNLLSFIYYKIYNSLVSDKRFHASPDNSALSLMSRNVVNNYIKVGDYRRHHLMILRWLGFKSSSIIIKHEKRGKGKSSYNMSKLIDHAIDGIFFNSNKILFLTTKLGLIISFISFLGVVYLIVSYYIKSYQDGWTSLAVLILFSTGVIVFCIGIVGLYIGKSFEQAKGRPKFVIDKKVNF